MRSGRSGRSLPSGWRRWWCSTPSSVRAASCGCRVAGRRWLALSSVLETIGFCTLAIALSRGPVAVVAVVASQYPVIAVTGAALLLRERLRTRQWVGVGARAGLGGGALGLNRLIGSWGVCWPGSCARGCWRFDVGRPNALRVLQLSAPQARLLPQKSFLASRVGLRRVVRATRSPGSEHDLWLLYVDPRLTGLAEFAASGEKPPMVTAPRPALRATGTSSSSLCGCSDRAFRPEFICSSRPAATRRCRGAQRRAGVEAAQVVHLEVVRVRARRHHAKTCNSAKAGGSARSTASAVRSRALAGSGRPRCRCARRSRRRAPARGPG